MLYIRLFFSKLLINLFMWSKWNFVRLYVNYMKIFKILLIYYNVLFCMWYFFYNLSMRVNIGLLNIFYKYMCIFFFVLYF